MTQEMTPDLVLMEKLVAGSPTQGDEAHPSVKPRPRIGRVISASGAQVLVMTDHDMPDEKNHTPHLGSLICFEMADSVVLGTVGAMSSPSPGMEEAGNGLLILEVDIFGNLENGGQGLVYRQDSHQIPYPGCVAAMAVKADVEAAYDTQNPTTLSLGELGQFPDVKTRHDVNALVYGNFAMVGASQSGKSCAIVRLVREMIRKRTMMRTIIFDQNNEYGVSFGNMARIVSLKPGMFPHWVLTFKELTFAIEQVTGSLSGDERTLLEEAIIYGRRAMVQSSLKKSPKETIFASVDTPVPYKMSEVISYLDRSSSTDHDYVGATYRRLRTKLMVMTKDRRYSAIFGAVGAIDSLAMLMGALFAIPLNNRPVTLVQMAGAPKALSRIIVSVVSRLAAEVSHWSHGGVPMMLVVEEAEQYLGKDKALSSALMRLLENGRKASIGVGLLSSRPRTLCAQALQQCATIFTMRLTNSSDRAAIEKVMPQSALGLLPISAILGIGEAIGAGQGVNIPARMRFARIPDAAVPVQGARAVAQGVLPPSFSEEQDAQFLENVITRWRYQSDTADQTD